MTDNAPRNQVPLVVGFIATGDELTQGDILNTNGQYMARKLHELGFQINQHIIVDDDEQHIESAIHYQLQQHDIIILSGGLGPTSDDRTRFALAKSLNKTLILDDASWQAICCRLAHVNLPTGEHNRQQALFPEGATILANSNGTAAACYINVHGKMLFMLPGPPQECLPIFDQQIIARLKPHAIPHHHFKWLLMGASEGDIAAKLDKRLAKLDCRTGYRWAYPYLECKVYAANQHVLAEAEQQVTSLLHPYLVSKHALDYQQQLHEILSQGSYHVYFDNQPLSQLVKIALLDNTLHEKLLSENTQDSIAVSITGLEEYWQQQPTPTNTQFKLTLCYQDKQESINVELFYRDHQVLRYVIAAVCGKIINFIDAL